jgi:hypothetical protein
VVFLLKRFHVIRLNARCKDGTVAKGSLCCTEKCLEKEMGKKEQKAEKPASTKKKISSDKSSSMMEIINGKGGKGDFDKMTKILASMSKADLSKVVNVLDEKTRTFKLDTRNENSMKQYERLSVAYGYARDALENKIEESKTKNKSLPVKHEEFKDFDKAIDILGAKVTIVGKASKAESLKTLNKVSEERARIYNEFPMLKKLDISEYKIDDEALGRHGGAAKFDSSDNSMTLLSNSASRGKNAAVPKGSKAKNDRYGVRQLSGTSLSDLYRHEVGHAALQQLTTKEERNAIYASWKGVSHSFGGGSDLYNKIEGQVSEYATKTPDECFSEMFSMATNGHEFDNDFYPEMVAPLKRILSRTKLNSVMIDNNLKNVIQAAFETSLSSSLNTIKLNYKCPEGKYVPNSFSCGETKAEAAKNMKNERRLKREAKKAKKEGKSLEVSKVSEAIKQVKVEKESGKVSKESVDNLKEVLGKNDLITNKPNKSVKLSAKDRDTISAYSGFKYTSINNYMNGVYMGFTEKQLNEVRSDITDLNRIIENNKIDSDLTVWRGLSGQSKLNFLSCIKGTKEGDNFEYKGFVSTSPDKSVSDRFASYEKKPYMMKINIPAGSNAMDITRFSAGKKSGESEILITSNSTFKLEKIEKIKGGGTLYHVSLLPRTKKEALNDTTRPEKESKTYESVGSDPIEKMRFDYFVRGDHIFDDREVEKHRNEVEKLSTERDKIYKTYSLDLKSSEKKKIMSQMKAIDEKRDAAIEKRANAEKALIVEDLKEMSIAQRIAYRDVLQNIVRNQSDPGTSEGRARQALQMEQLYAATDFIKEHGDRLKMEVSHKKFNKVSDAEKEMGLKINITEESALSNPKVCLDTLNIIGKERSRMLNEFPALKELDLPEIALADSELGSYLATYNPSSKKLTFHYNASLERVVKRRSRKDEIKGCAIDGLVGTYCHEVGHAVQYQLFTPDENSLIRKEWKEKKLDKESVDKSFGAYNANSNNIKRAISSYAITDEDECVAEMFSMMTNGKEVNRDLLPSAYDAINRVLRRKE